jgi:hypothetical protein
MLSLLMTPRAQLVERLAMRRSRNAKPRRWNWQVSAAMPARNSSRIDRLTSKSVPRPQILGCWLWRLWQGRHTPTTDQLGP